MANDNTNSMETQNMRYSSIESAQTLKSMLSSIKLSYQNLDIFFQNFQQVECNGGVKCTKLVSATTSN